VITATKSKVQSKKTPPPPFESACKLNQRVTSWTQIPHKVEHLVVAGGASLSKRTSHCQGGDHAVHLGRWRSRAYRVHPNLPASIRHAPRPVRPGPRQIRRNPPQTNRADDRCRGAKCRHCGTAPCPRGVLRPDPALSEDVPPPVALPCQSGTANSSRSARRSWKRSRCRGCGRAGTIVAGNSKRSGGGSAAKSWNTAPGHAELESHLRAEIVHMCDPRKKAQPKRTRAANERHAEVAGGGGRTKGRAGAI
jgi:hypothetical protein